jgi:hypothetical protein
MDDCVAAAHGITDGVGVANVAAVDEIEADDIVTGVFKMGGGAAADVAPIARDEHAHDSLIVLDVLAG